MITDPACCKRDSRFPCHISHSPHAPTWSNVRAMEIMRHYPRWPHAEGLFSKASAERTWTRSGIAARLSVKPVAIYFGQGGAPFLTRLHWSSWNTTSAWATGKLWTQKPRPR